MAGQHLRAGFRNRKKGEGVCWIQRGMLGSCWEPELVRSLEGNSHVVCHVLVSQPLHQFHVLHTVWSLSSGVTTHSETHSHFRSLRMIVPKCSFPALPCPWKGSTPCPKGAAAKATLLSSMGEMSIDPLSSSLDLPCRSHATGLCGPPSIFSLQLVLSPSLFQK